jgi:alanyl-tRNA synthetase
MTSREIRQAFLDFFAERKHRVVPSSPLVLPRDPTLLFANAGMNQFKDVFTGRDERDYVRAVSSQKCLRVSGKHNDLEMVGRTPRHHTFFEMLGNFSFGDYFKEEAARFAWELMTDRFGIPTDRLWVTVFGGTDALEADDSAHRIWSEEIGVANERILRLGEKDNFWRMGETGPCGPCTELHYDLGPELTSVAGPSNPETDERRFMEVWNLVFMQFDQRKDGTLVELPSKSVDTGMGLERITAVLQGKQSNFDTDLFRPLIETTAALAGVRPYTDDETDFSLRVIADHARALCFLVADGVVPANDRRGYVLRRLLRRAIRHGRKLGLDEPFLQRVTPAVIDGLGEVYPELLAAQDAIIEVGRREEDRFAETLTAGLALLEGTLAKLEDGDGPRVLPGDELFRLYDTYGFPLELARDVAEERGVLLDEAGFEERMAGQRSRAQASWKGGGGSSGDESYVELARRCSTEFQGYDRDRVEDVPVLALLRDGQPVDRLEEGEEGEIVLEATPFYAESGGQVADTGFVVGKSGRARIVDVKRPAEALTVHRARIEHGVIQTGDRAVAEIDEARREAIRRNHTATHLLHAALREVVGTHVKQAGSLVAPDRLRFDFSHFSALGDRARADIESLVNRVVLEDLPVDSAESDLGEALENGAMALFGEKYGDRVRTVRIGEFSLELCGGTHTSRTGEIGLIKLTDEHGVASGVRRIEAVSGTSSLDRFREEHGIVRRLEEQLSVPRERLFDEVERRLTQLKELQRALEKQRLGAVLERLKQKAANPDVVCGVGVLTERVDGLSPQEMRELADSLRGKLKSGVVVLGRAAGDKVSVLVAVTEDLRKRLPAGDLVRELGPMIGGGGGGRPDMAEAGGKNAAGLDAALKQAIESVGRRLEESR